MKYLLLLCFLYFDNDIKAQNTYRINYSHVKYFADSSTKKGVSDFKWSARLVYNDSISFYYMIPNGSKKDKFKNYPVIGDKLIHHGLIYNSRTNEMLNEVAWPKGRYFVIVDSPRHFNWEFKNQTKNILSYACSLAYSVNETNDTTMVWYDPELDKGFGPTIFFGLPGLVLEVFDQQNSSHYMAEKIELTSLTLVLPQNVERIPIDKYRKQKATTINEKK
jgi:GLPGLI family protein